MAPTRTPPLNAVEPERAMIASPFPQLLPMSSGELPIEISSPDPSPARLVGTCMRTAAVGTVGPTGWTSPWALPHDVLAALRLGRRHGAGNPPGAMDRQLAPGSLVRSCDRIARVMPAVIERLHRPRITISLPAGIASSPR
jgi:hypothetical protein